MTSLPCLEKLSLCLELVVEWSGVGIGSPFLSSFAQMSFKRASGLARPPFLTHNYCQQGAVCDY